MHRSRGVYSAGVEVDVKKSQERLHPKLVHVDLLADSNNYIKNSLIYNGNNTALCFVTLVQKTVNLSKCVIALSL